GQDRGAGLERDPVSNASASLYPVAAVRDPGARSRSQEAAHRVEGRRAESGAAAERLSFPPALLHGPRDLRQRGTAAAPGRRRALVGVPLRRAGRTRAHALSLVRTAAQKL